MHESMIFDRNLLSLAPRHEDLCKRLTEAVTDNGYYIFLTSRTGDVIPAGIDKAGGAHPLHSMVDPKREAQRLVATVKPQSSLVLFGIGGGYNAEAALERQDIHSIVIIDYCIDSIAELFAAREYHRILSDPRVTLLIDPSPQEISSLLFSVYRPAFSGGISVLPLRARTELAMESFTTATTAVRDTIECISQDFSVQVHFGKRWFSNTLRNVLSALGTPPPVPPSRHFAIVAAGPSLDDHLEELRNRKHELFILSCDTALSALLAGGIIPNAVISIDCQHISYYHFLDSIPPTTLVFLDLASPPLLAHLTDSPRFFSGAHPLSCYIARHWRSFPNVDSSGGNVSYAAVSLASLLGAESIELYGADYSYPEGRSYTRGTYIHKLFSNGQNRLNPIESQFSHFLFRNRDLQLVRSQTNWRYETRTLNAYRERLEELSEHLDCQILSRGNSGAPIRLAEKQGQRPENIHLWSAGKPAIGVQSFLITYREKIAALPALEGPLAIHYSRLTNSEKEVFTTLLPTAATFRQEYPESTPGEIMEKVRNFCLNEIDKVLALPQ